MYKIIVKAFFWIILIIWWITIVYWENIIKRDIEKNINDIYEQSVIDTTRLTQLDFTEHRTGEMGVVNYPKYLPKTWTPSSLTKLDSQKARKIIELDLPKYVGKNAWSYNDDINFWKQSVPKMDRERNRYIVVPSTGLVIPLNVIAKDTGYYNSMKEGEYVDINTYLQDGASVYAWTEGKWFGKLWNPVIYGHSSYWKNKPGRYKTHFQTIIGLPEGEEIWVYEKKEASKFKRYRYKIEKSYETTKNDFSVLDVAKWRNLTLMTCTPIGGTSWRWVVKAKFVDEEKQELKRRLGGSNFDKMYWKLIERTITHLRQKDSTNAREDIVTKFTLLTNFEKKWGARNIQDFITYFKLRLAQEYHFLK